MRYNYYSILAVISKKDNPFLENIIFAFPF